jgi:hypothetical protein
MTDTFQAEMLDFCVRFLSRHGGQLSAEQLSTLSVLFPRQVPAELNPMDPTSPPFQFTLAVENFPFSEYAEPVEEVYSIPQVPQQELVTIIVEAPAPQRRCPYGYNGKWASPIPVLIVKQLLKRQWKVTLKDVVKKYAKHGEKRLTHEMAINYLAERKRLTPEEFLRTVEVPHRVPWNIWSNRGEFCLTDW